MKSEVGAAERAPSAAGDLFEVGHCRFRSLIYVPLNHKCVTVLPTQGPPDIQ